MKGNNCSFRHDMNLLAGRFKTAFFFLHLEKTKSTNLSPDLVAKVLQVGAKKRTFWCVLRRCANGGGTDARKEEPPEETDAHLPARISVEPLHDVLKFAEQKIQDGTRRPRHLCDGLCSSHVPTATAMWIEKSSFGFMSLTVLQDAFFLTNCGCRVHPSKFVCITCARRDALQWILALLLEASPSTVGQRSPYFFGRRRCDPRRRGRRHWRHGGCSWTLAASSRTAPAPIEHMAEADASQLKKLVDAMLIPKAAGCTWFATEATATWVAVSGRQSSTCSERSLCFHAVFFRTEHFHLTFCNTAAVSPLSFA